MQAIVSYVMIPFLDNLNEIETLIDLFRIKNTDNMKISLVNCNVKKLFSSHMYKIRFNSTS